MFLILFSLFIGEEYFYPSVVNNFFQCILCSFQRSNRRNGGNPGTENMVGVTGVEPVTSSLSGTRSNQLSYTPGGVGGGNGVRTRDFQLAKLALYQLSYAPVVCRPGATRPNSQVTPIFSDVHSLAYEAEAVRQAPQPVSVVFLGWPRSRRSLIRHAG